MLLFFTIGSLCSLVLYLHLYHERSQTNLSFSQDAWIIYERLKEVLHDRIEYNVQINDIHPLIRNILSKSYFSCCKILNLLIILNRELVSKKRSVFECFEKQRRNVKQHDRDTQRNRHRMAKDYETNPTSSPVFEMLSTNMNQNIKKYNKVGRACDPDISIDQKALKGGNIYEIVHSETEQDGRRKILNLQLPTEDDAPFPGMLLQIFQSSSDVEESLTHGAMEVRRSAEVSPYLYRQPCNTVQSVKSRSQSNPNEYLLLEVMHDNLGRVDLHNLDYAYRPVVAETSYYADGKTGIWSNLWFWNQHGSEYDYERMGKRAFAGGSHGEVWKARRRCNQVVNVKDQHSQSFYTKFQTPKCDESTELILKRMKVGQDPKLLEAGLREIYFGDILNRCDQSSSLFTTYVDHFFHHSYTSANCELWIVFQNAGPSLRSYIYTPVSSGDFVIYQHSSLWRRLRMEVTSRSHDSTNSVAVVTDQGSKRYDFIKNTNANNSIHLKQSNFLNMSDSTINKLYGTRGDLLKDILRQILTSAAKLHERGVVHRDIKPSNIMCSTDNILNEFGINCVLGDFSSAWDDFSAEKFYSKGPSAAEQTNEYAPPEVLVLNNRRWIPFFQTKPESYDSWSIGVVILELLLGTPNVFSVDQRTTTLLTNKLNKVGASQEDIQRALYLAALSQFCIYIPTNESDEDRSWPLREGDPLFKAYIVKKTCTINDFHSALRARDPLGLGFDKSLDPLLQLVWGLLSWDPKDRLTAAEALEHFYFTKKGYSEDGQHNALEPQMLDPRLDMDIEKQIVDTFVCPKCGRKFKDLQSCQAHATGRRHAKFCEYDRSLLPPCLNAHSMLPSHPTSGYCDIQGRRKVIEDFHTVHLRKDHQFYGVFDGHNGNLASKYAASALYKQLLRRLKDVDDDIMNGYDWKKEVEEEMKDSFEELHEGVSKAIESYPSGTVMAKSGTTATALYVTEHAVIVASVGDSRAVLSVGTSYNCSDHASSIQLTFDHVAADENERRRIESQGGVVESRGGIPRVNGTLVLSRSIGDLHLAKFLSRTPSVVAMTKSEVRENCRVTMKINDEMPCFIILASDGLWDALSNQEAVDLVEQVIQKYDRGSWDEDGGAFQEAAEILTQEAYTRGSTDNIGVCVVAVD